MKILLSLVLALLIVPAHARIKLDDLREAARSNNLPQLARLADKSQGDLLEMYPQYYWLSAQTSTLDEAQAKQFLDRYPNSPLANRFRNEWLKELARREAWDAYSELYPSLSRPAIEMQCWQANAEMKRGNAIPALQLRPLWFTGKSRPQPCGDVFDVLFEYNKLIQEDIWTRLRLALSENNLQLVESLSLKAGLGTSLSEKSLQLLRNAPEKAWPHDPNSRVARERALYALYRFARTDSARAAQLLSDDTQGWPLADQQYGWETLATVAAKNHEPQALSWFQKTDLRKIDTASRIWLIRASLRAGDWAMVESQITALPPSERSENAWQYWYARALQQRGRHAEAVKIFNAIADSDEFYGLLAREELGSMIESPAVQYRASEDEVRTVQRLPGIQRALLLMQNDWRSEAMAEWNDAIQGLNDQLLIAAAQLAQRENWHDRAIYTASRTQQLHNYALRYLTPFRGKLDRAALKEGLDPAWVYGLVRQESRFMPEVRSSAGAMGLMQIMPATAQWIASKKGIKRFKSADALEVSTNVEFGNYYLRQAWEKLDYSQVLASAGYNAGPSRARRWQADVPLEAAIYIESIPFTETRDYVKKVMANAMHYAHILGSERSTLKMRISIIPARENSTPNLP